MSAARRDVNGFTPMARPSGLGPPPPRTSPRGELSHRDQGLQLPGYLGRLRYGLLRQYTLTGDILRATLTYVPLEVRYVLSCACKPHRSVDSGHERSLPFAAIAVGGDDNPESPLRTRGSP